MTKILVFTDSRGQHKRGDYKLYWERLAEKYNKLDVYLCPYKWTTTLDFLELIANGEINPEKYDIIILHTGIVEWSPRPWSNAYNDLYHPLGNSIGNLENITLNTNNYTQKVRNHKKDYYDWVFGEEAMENYLKKENALITEFEGERTINLYSLEMMEERLFVFLQMVENLIWISCNPIIPEWKGTYFRQRPENINLIMDYSRSMTEKLGADNVVDLNNWTEEEIKLYTLDNMHLTQAGSDYIYDKLDQMIQERIFT